MNIVEQIKALDKEHDELVKRTRIVRNELKLLMKTEWTTEETNEILTYFDAKVGE